MRITDLNKLTILTRIENEEENIKIAITLGEDNNFWLKPISKDDIGKYEIIFRDADSNTFYTFDTPVIMN